MRGVGGDLMRDLVTWTKRRIVDRFIVFCEDLDLGMEWGSKRGGGVLSF